jgi:outer membrane protein OmpA-like peptidoglycan-associated protein
MCTRVTAWLTVIVLALRSMQVANAESDFDPSWNFPKAGDLYFPRPETLILPVATPYGGNLTGLSSNISGMSVSESGLEVQINLSSDVLFDFDKATLSPKAVNALTQAAEIIRERAKGRVVIEGHADGKGEANYNLRLSQQRAKAVMRWLSNQAGLASGNLSAIGYGMQRPVAPNSNPDGSDNPEGRQRNRRVEIKFPKSP